ncbi:MAG: YybS family protein [Deltaproteobacteria bacterium]|nr:MAG: YybS family protein [Deltaproteobacteria bacterium]
MPLTATAETIKDISIGIALTSFLFTVTVLSPIFGFFCTIFIPLPTLYYRTKLGRKYGAVVPAATMLLLIVMLGRLSIDIIFFFELLLIGFAMGELFALNLSIEKTVTYACMAVLVSGIVVLFFYSSISTTGIKTIISDYVRKNLELTIELYKAMGMSPESVRMFSESLEKIHFVIVRIVPALVITSTLFIIWATLILSKPLLVARKLVYPDFGPLNIWKAPDYLVWVVIGCGLMLLIPNTSLKLLGTNGLLILMTIYFFQGIAIVSFFFDKKRFPRLLRFILYTLIALQQILLLIVIGLGFFDVWLNFRKLKPVKQN